MQQRLQLPHRRGGRRLFCSLRTRNFTGREIAGTAAGGVARDAGCWAWSCSATRAGLVPGTRCHGCPPLPGQLPPSPVVSDWG